MFEARVFTAMATPMTRDGAVDCDRAEQLAARLVERGSDGLVVAGSTGESATLAHSERLELVAAVAGAVGGSVPVVANAGTNNTAESVELTRQLSRPGVAGIMAVVPYYNKPCQSGLVRHFREIAAATELPVMLYNVPGRTGLNMVADTVLQLARVDNIVAVKEASGDLDQIGAIASEAPRGFDVYSGDDGLTLPILSVGGVGVVSVASHLAGFEIQAMIKAFAAGDPIRARTIHHQLRPLFSVLFIGPNPAPLKAALELAGFGVGPPRLPLVEPGPGDRELIARVVREL